MTTEQLSRLRNAAHQARVCELQTGIPCELVVSQWALESGWGAFCPGNNAFGIKSYSGEFGNQLLTTPEFFTVQELADFLSRGDGREAVDANKPPLPSGRRQFTCKDRFATFLTLADCFAKRAALFNQGSYRQYAAAYRSNKDVMALIRGISGIYATSPDYSNTLISILSKEEVLAAISEARSVIITSNPA